MIIVSGMAAAGKTTFAEWFSQEVCAPLFSVDDLWEKMGTAAIPFAQYWVLCESIMKQSLPLIIEFGFWDEQKPMINELVEKYNYQTVNVHFVASVELSHRRFNDRRKLSGVKPQITLERYKEIIEHSKNFRFGNYVIHVDTTDFSSVAYADIAKQIQQHTIDAQG